MIQQRVWLQQHSKWLVSTVLVTLFLIIFISSGMNKVASDLTLAYSDTELYNNALEKVKENEAAVVILGTLEPINKLAILEGEIHYSESYTVVESSIRIIGTKGKARLDFIANKVNKKWIYKSIDIRIKQPKHQQQKITIL